MARCKPQDQSFQGITAGQFVAYTAGKGVRVGTRIGQVVKVLVRNLQLRDPSTNKVFYVQHNEQKNVVLSVVGETVAGVLTGTAPLALPAPETEAAAG